MQITSPTNMDKHKINLKQAKHNNTTNNSGQAFSPDAIAVEATEVHDEPALTPDIEANKKIFYEYFNIEYAKSVAKFVLTPIEKYYFRAEFIGFEGENFPERNNPKRPLIFASNHSGMAFPWDGIIFASGLMRISGYDLSKACRGLASPMLSQSTLMNPFLIPKFWKRAGGIDATTLNFDTMMHFSESNILIYPEGVEGIGKGFDKRYRLQRLSTSALRMSLKYKTDIIPFATVNAEYINPFSYSVPELNALSQKIGIPFLPLGLTTLLVLLQPWMFYFAFPAKLVYVRGRRIKTYEMLAKPFEEITKEDLSFLRDRVHHIMQLELDEAVRKFGQKPFEWAEFFETIATNWNKMLYFLPPVWSFIFVDHERRYAEMQEKLTQYSQNTPEDLAKRQAVIEAEMKPQEDTTLMEMVQTAVGMVTRNPEVLFMYLPIGGWGYMVWKGFQKN